MSINQSNLSGDTSFDIVYAVTQDSLNYVIKDYLLNGTFPKITKYYQSGANNAVYEADYNSFMMQTQGTDPLVLPTINNGDNDNTQLRLLANANFLYAYEFQLGIPDCIEDLLNFSPLTLNADGTADLILVCKEFKVCDTSYSTNWSGTFISRLTAAAQTEAAWKFTFTVPLSTVEALDNYPADVQAQVASLGKTPFSIKKLILDFSNPVLKTSFSIPGIVTSSRMYKVLNSLFATQYYGAMQNFKDPDLNYTITQDTDAVTILSIGNITLEAQPFVNTSGQAVTDQSDPDVGLATLNYQCTATGKAAQPAKVLPWNWLDSATDENSYQGVVAIARNTLISYFRQQLDTYVSGNCLVPAISVTTDSNGGNQYSFSLTPGGKPTTDGGQGVLEYQWSQAARYVDNVSGGQLVIIPQYDLTLDFTGKTIVVTQIHELVVTSTFPGAHGGETTGRAEFIDTYTMVTDAAAKTLDLVCSSQVTRWPDLATPVLGIDAASTQQLMTAIAAAYANISSTNFQEVPISVARKMIFPGGNTFAFANAQFSDNKDLVATINYVAAV